LAVAGIVSACGSSSSSSGSAARSPATIPLAMTPQQGRGGPPAVRAIVHVRVGNGPAIPVLLDTGSQGLRVLPSALGPGIRVSNRIVHETYGGGETFFGRQAFARVTIGSLTTRSPIGIQVFQRVVCSPHAPCSAKAAVDAAFAASGAKGIMGVDTQNAFGQNLYSPLLQLPAPYSEGFTLRLAPQGTGTLTLGPPKLGPGWVTLPLMRSNPPKYRTGAAAYQRQVNVCWSFQAVRRCGRADFDIGTPTPNIAPLTGIRTIAVHGGRIVRPGIPVTVSTPSGAAIWRYTTNTQYGAGLTQVFPGLQKLANLSFITGITPFYSHTIGWDMQTGQMVISPN
jgi:hypothetical protein